DRLQLRRGVVADGHEDAAAARQRDELLNDRFAVGVDADDLAAPIAVNRCRENLCARGGGVIGEDLDVAVVVRVPVCLPAPGVDVPPLDGRDQPAGEQLVCRV